MSYLVYSAHDMNLSEPNLIPGYSYRLWRPSLCNCIPPSLSAKFAIWTLAHYLRVFHNQDFAVLLIVDTKGAIVHRSCIVPSYFRWPFMKNNDLQISSTWTEPDHRGKGLAKSALQKAIIMLNKQNRTFWYVTREANSASIAVCEKVGFTLAGHAQRVSWMGIKLLGRLVIED